METIPQEQKEDSTNPKNKYRGDQSINFVAMMDDLLGLSYEGMNSVKMDAFDNTKTSEKMHTII